MNAHQLPLPGFEDYVETEWSVNTVPRPEKKKAIISWSRVTYIICPDCLNPVREFHIDGRSCFYCDGPQRCHIVMGDAKDPFNGRRHLTQRQWRKATREGNSALSRSGLN
jgi:hypothetical protein